MRPLPPIQATRQYEVQLAADPAASRRYATGAGDDTRGLAKATLRQARERIGEGLRAVEADNIAESDEISLRNALIVDHGTDSGVDAAAIGRRDMRWSSSRRC